MWSLLFVVALASPLCISARYNDYEAVYPYYKMVEEAVTTNSKSLYLLRQGFLPVVTAQPWLIDDVETLLIIADVDYYNGECCTGNNTSVSFKRIWEFRWTDSSLLSLISPDELLAFDPVVFRIIYSSIMHSNQKSLVLPIQLKDNSSNTTDVKEIEDRLMKAVTLFFSWGKAYARSNGKPTLWDKEDQGYIGSWYSHYAIGSPFTIQYNYQKHFNRTHFVFLLIFIFLNILVPVALLSNANKWNKKLKKVFHRQHTNFTAIIFFWATGATVTLFNTMYIILMIGIHMRGYPTALNCFLNTGKECTVPKTEYENTFTIEALISKAVVFPVATAIELFAAVIAARKLDIPAPPLFTAKICRCCKMARYVKYFVFWQILVFAQIVVGLMGIPLIITLVISPAQTTSQLISLIVTLLSLAVLIGYVFSIQWRRSVCNLKSVFKYSISFLAAALTIATLSAVLVEYNCFIEGGLSMKGFKGYILSLFLTILLSLFVWALKRKFVKSSSEYETLEYSQRKESGSEVEVEPLLKDTKGVDLLV